MALIPYGSVLGNAADAGRIGILKSLNLGGQINYVSDITEEFNDGSPSAPCLKVNIPQTSFRFRWVVRSGTHTIQVNAKQVINQNPRPSMTIRANSTIGIGNDIITYAPMGTGWTVIGPVTVTATAKGAVYIDLTNNYGGTSNTPALFDHIVTS